jgi:hypothetical protein
VSSSSYLGSKSIAVVAVAAAMHLLPIDPAFSEEVFHFHAG